MQFFLILYCYAENIRFDVNESCSNTAMDKKAKEIF